MRIVRYVFWTDSTAVLQYIRNEDKRFHTFVANRLLILHDGSRPSQWNFVDSNGNPADNASRGLTVEELLSQDRWFKGPQFLRSNEALWPIFLDPLQPIRDQDPEIKRRAQANPVTEVTVEYRLDLIFQRYFSWYALKKGVAWILRFTNYIQKKMHSKERSSVSLDGSRFPGELSLEELKSSGKCIISYDQKTSFPEVIIALQSLQDKRELC